MKDAELFGSVLEYGMEFTAQSVPYGLRIFHGEGSAPEVDLN